MALVTDNEQLNGDFDFDFTAEPNVYKPNATDEVYFEKQSHDSLLCGQHCINNLLQGPYFTAFDLGKIGQQLDEAEESLLTMIKEEKEETKNEAKNEASIMDEIFDANVITTSANTDDSKNNVTDVIDTSINNNNDTKTDGKENDSKESNNDKKQLPSAIDNDFASLINASLMFSGNDDNNDNENDNSSNNNNNSNNNNKNGNGKREERDRNYSNVSMTGLFSLDVLKVGLQELNLTLIPLLHPSMISTAKEKPENEVGFICYQREHWISFRKLMIRKNVNETKFVWYVLNSLKNYILVEPQPIEITEFYLNVIMTQLQDKGFQVFVVRGRWPMLSRNAPKSNQLKGIYQWYNVNDVKTHVELTKLSEKLQKEEESVYMAQELQSQQMEMNHLQSYQRQIYDNNISMGVKRLFGGNNNNNNKNKNKNNNKNNNKKNNKYNKNNNKHNVDTEDENYQIALAMSKSMDDISLSSENIIESNNGYNNSSNGDNNKNHGNNGGNKQDDNFIDELSYEDQVKLAVLMSADAAKN